MDSAPSVFADANALYPPALRYLLIELADAGIIRLHWSPEVLAELTRAILRVRPATDPVRLANQIAHLDKALPTASVAPSPAAATLPRLPDPKDDHVLASAWEAGCSILLTFNLRDFPASSLGTVDPPIVPVHPDAFLLRLLTTEAAVVLPIIDRLRRSLTRPPLSAAGYTDNLARAGLLQSAELLKHLLPL